MPAANSTVAVRRASVADMGAVFGLIAELAAYERALPELKNTVAQLQADGFGEQAWFQCFVAEENNVIIGLAIIYPSYSTWKGKSFYLEDLVVSEKHRGRGIGDLLMQAVAKFAVAKNAQQLRWHVLNWNEPAIRFYEKMKPSFEADWVTCKLSAEQLTAF